MIRILGHCEDVASASFPFTPPAKHALELAAREAEALGVGEVATHHILLGLLREDEGLGTRVLSELHVDRERIRELVLAGLDDASREEPQPEDRPVAWQVTVQLSRRRRCIKSSCAPAFVRKGGASL